MTYLIEQSIKVNFFQVCADGSLDNIFRSAAAAKVSAFQRTNQLRESFKNFFRLGSVASAAAAAASASACRYVDNCTTVWAKLGAANRHRLPCGSGCVCVSERKNMCECFVLLDIGESSISAKHLVILCVNAGEGCEVMWQDQSQRHRRRCRCQRVLFSCRLFVLSRNVLAGLGDFSSRDSRTRISGIFWSR